MGYEFRTYDKADDLIWHHTQRTRSRIKLVMKCFYLEG